MSEAAATIEPPLPVLILIHGATLNGHMWDPVRRHLDPRFAKVLAPDLPGHGSRRGERFTMEAAVATIADLTRSLDGAPVILAGDSLGGFTALASAAAVPQAQLRGLVLSGCTANVKGLKILLHFIPKATLIKALLAVFGEHRLLGQVQNKTRDMLKGAQVADEDIDALLASGLSMRAFPEAVSALTGVDYRAKLAAVSQPVVLVNGDKDHVMLQQEADFIATARRGQHRRFDCEHGVSLLRSAQFAGLINEFALGTALSLAPNAAVMRARPGKGLSTKLDEQGR